MWQLGLRVHGQHRQAVRRGEAVPALGHGRAARGGHGQDRRAPSRALQDPRRLAFSSNARPRPRRQFKQTPRRQLTQPSGREPGQRAGRTRSPRGTGADATATRTRRGRMPAADPRSGCGRAASPARTHSGTRRGCAADRGPRRARRRRPRGRPRHPSNSVSNAARSARPRGRRQLQRRAEQRARRIDLVGEGGRQRPVRAARGRRRRRGTGSRRPRAAGRDRSRPVTPACALSTSPGRPPHLLRRRRGRSRRRSASVCRSRRIGSSAKALCCGDPRPTTGSRDLQQDRRRAAQHERAVARRIARTPGCGSCAHARPSTARTAEVAARTVPRIETARVDRGRVFDGRNLSTSSYLGVETVRAVTDSSADGRSKRGSLRIPGPRSVREVRRARARRASSPTPPPRRAPRPRSSAASPSSRRRSRPAVAARPAASRSPRPRMRPRPPPRRSSASTSRATSSSA